MASFDSPPGAGFDTDPASAAIVPPAGRVTGSGPVLVIDPAQNNAFKAINLAWRQGGTVQASAGPSGAPIRYAIRGLAAGAQDGLVKSLALQAERTPSAPGRAIHQPRIGLYQPWSGSMGEGWTRWILEQYGFAFVGVHPEDFKSPLAEKIDVLIIADDARVPLAPGVGSSGSTGGTGVAGRGGRGGPVRPEYAYQLTAGDLQGFEQFVRGGGTVLCLSNASAFAIQQLKLPVRNVVAGLRPEEFFLRGSVVQVTTDPTHPVMAGMPDKAAVFVDGSPVFETLDGFTGTVLARYQDSGSPLLAGYLIGETFLHGKAAALDVHLDAGHVVLLGFRPEWRGQPFGTFRVLLNAALYAR
jgi:ribosomal protein S18 acetylase RimI-like enzyme